MCVAGGYGSEHTCSSAHTCPLCMLSPGRKPDSYNIVLPLRAVEQPQSWALGSFGEGSHGAGDPLASSVAHRERWTKLCHLLHPAPPCAQQHAVHPVPVGWCQRVLCTLSRGSGASCGCPAQRLQGDSCSWFPLPAPRSSWPLPLAPTLPWQGRV